MTQAQQAQRELAAGMEAHRHGQLDAAALRYQAVLRLHADHPDALHLLGQIERARGKPEQGLALVQRAIRIHLAPSYFSTIGSILGELGRNEEALAAFDRGLALQPGHIGLLFNKGNAFKRLRRHDQAIAVYRRLLAIDPKFVDARHNLGTALIALGKFEEAVAELKQAEHERAGDIDLQVSLGAALVGLMRWSEARPHYERALKLDAGLVEARLGLARCRFEDGDSAAAMQSLEAMLARDPALSRGHMQLGYMLLQGGEFDRALEHYGIGLAGEPDSPDARFGRGQILLRLGRWAEGWRDFESRLDVPGMIAQRNTGLPPWRGEDLAGKRLLVVGEQGLGDTLQFLRFVAMVQERGASCMLWPQRPLVALLKSGFHACPVIGELGEAGDADFSVSLLSLPFRLGLDREPAPEAAPYLACEPRRIERWRKWLEPAGSGPAGSGPAGSGSMGRFRIGVAWQGSRVYLADRLRSFHPSEFRVLAERPGVELISLQMGEDQALAGIDWVRRPPPQFDGDGAFLDTAALMQSLDLVVCADTALAHLAGALARPAWLALDTVGDWRWPVGRAQSPWYRTARLYRQQTRGDWNGVFAAIAADLDALLKARRGG